MIYCVDVEGNLLEFVIYFFDGQLTDGDDHCVSLDLYEDALLLIGWCNEHVVCGHERSGDVGHGRENGQMRDVTAFCSLEMYKGAIIIETGRVPQRVVAQLGVMECTVISSVTATPSPWSKRTETFAHSWVAIRAFMAVYLFVSTQTMRALISRKSWADFGILRVITRG